MRKKGIQLLIVLFAVVLVLSLLSVKIVSVEGKAMYPGLSDGQKIVVHSIKSPWNQLAKLFSKDDSYPLKRFQLIAFRPPQLNDIPLPKRDLIIRRLIAFPGEEVLIEPNEVRIDNQAIPEPAEVIYPFRIVGNQKLSEEILNHPLLHFPTWIAAPGFYNAHLAPIHRDSLIQLPEIDQIREIREPSKQSAQRNFPKSYYIQWNQSFFGPVVIPKKNQTVTLNEQNIDLYRRIIEVYEGNDLEITSNKEFVIQGITTRYYTFRQNYYFVLNDFRDEFGDSRTWGFLPEDHIVGFRTLRTVER